MAYAKIVGTGRYVPERCVTNAEFDRRYGRDIDGWLRENVGIQTRHFAAPHELGSDLAVHAAQQALERARLQAQELDLLIVATDTPDYISPATASVVQHKLGAPRAGVFDVNNACAAFVTGLTIGAKYIATEPARYRNALVVGTYAMSKYVNWDDYKTATLFADGAGAVVLQAADAPGLLSSAMAADGQYHDYMGIYVGGTSQVPEAANLDQKYLTIAKRFPPDLNATHWPQLVRQVCQGAQAQVKDINRIYFTQINLNTIKQVMNDLGLPLERTHWIMDKWGYTGSACVPMALDDHVTQGKGPKPGDLVVFCASGGGHAMAAAAFRW